MAETDADATEAGKKSWKRFLSLRHQNIKLPPPNLLGVGAARCGTTALYHALAATPGVYMSPVKELAYFSNRFDQWSERDYLLFFYGSESARYRGEMSPHYLHHAETPARILAMSSGCKVIIQLRNPVARTVSHFRHHHAHHKIADVNRYFEIALKALADGQSDANLRFSHPLANLRQSFYFDGLKRYVDAFGQQNVFVLFLDDMRDTEATARRLSSWLGVEVKPAGLRVVNKSAKVQGSGSLAPALRERLAATFADDFRKTCRLLGRSSEEFVL